MNSSGSSSSTYALGKDNRLSTSYVAMNTQTTSKGERSRPYSGHWMMSGRDAPPNSEQSPPEGSSYGNQKQTLSTSSPSTQHSTSSSPQSQPNRPHTRMPSSPHGQKNSLTTHTSLHNSKPNATSPLPSTNELVVWKQLPRDRGGVTIGTNFHFPLSYGLPSIPEIPENPKD